MAHKPKSTLKECPIFGKTNLQKICITYHKIKKTTCFYISKVFQNAIFLFFIYNDIVLFYAYPVFYKRLAVYLGGRSNGLPTMPLLSAYFNSSSQLNHTPEFHVTHTNPNCYIGKFILRVNLFRFSTISLPL